MKIYGAFVCLVLCFSLLAQQASAQPGGENDPVEAFTHIRSLNEAAFGACVTEYKEWKHANQRYDEIEKERAQARFNARVLAGPENPFVYRDELAREIKELKVRNPDIPQVQAVLQRDLSESCSTFKLFMEKLKFY